MDPLKIVLDEVALEGLDGITASSLWTRLDNRTPPFTLILDPYTKEFLWKSLVCNEDVSFYELPLPRESIVLTDRFSEIDPETGIQEIRRLRLDAEDTVYPIKIIEDNQDGIQGSCVFFKERKDITEQLRRDDLMPLLTLEQALEKWGERLVAVASQVVRYRALIGPEGDPELKLSDQSYCILERLGRARWQGELQRDLCSNIFKVDAGKIHYLRSSLDKNQLVTMQTHVIRTASGGQQCSILLLLKRFHVDRRGKYDILMEATSKILSSLPNNIGIIIKLRHQLHVTKRTFTRVYQAMLAAKQVELLTLPLHKLVTDDTPVKTKRGGDIVVRCLKLLKPYGKKKNDDEEEEDEEESDGYNLMAEGLDMERDLATQAYEIVVQAGTKGISQTELRKRLNVGRLEARMVCRILSRNDMVKGYMEDIGRQRTNKYISKVFVEQSELKRQFVKEKQRSQQLLADSNTAEAPENPNPFVGPTPKHTPKPKPKPKPTPTARSKQTAKGKAVKSALELEVPECEGDTGRPASSQEEDGRKAGQQKSTKGSRKKRGGKNESRNEDPSEESLMEPSGKVQKQTRGKGRAKGKGKGKAQMPGTEECTASAGSGSIPTELTQTKLPFISLSPLPQQCSSSGSVILSTNESSALEDKEGPMEDVSQSDADVSATPSSAVDHENTVSQSCLLVEDNPKVVEVGPGMMSPEKSSKHSVKESYRVLKRKNFIIEAVRNLKIIENMFTLKNMLMEEERKDGVSTSVCKKSIVRLVRRLSREGFLRFYRTTVIQDGISKQVEFVVHPSITPDDPLIKSAIDQVRFRISGSYAAIRLRALEEAKTKEKPPPKEPQVKNTSKLDFKMGVEPLKNFKPTLVPGYGRTLGFQPKMPRLRLVHTFIWYLVYGHPLRQQQQKGLDASTVDLDETSCSSATGQNMEPDTQEAPSTSTCPQEEEVRPTGCQEKELNYEYDMNAKMRVYADELTWRRYVPPVRVHKEFGEGWALTSDLLISMPLSLLVQVSHVSYKVDGLDEYLKDPVKKHYLVRFLPGNLKRQLLYKRKYVFNFVDNIDRICSMGLMQFGPTERFQEKDQAFVFVKKNATITDTTTCDPHYNLAKSSRPFERRHYRFDTLQDVDAFWFDLLCVCLNTPLGLTRSQVRGEDDNRTKPDPHKYPSIRQHIPRSREVADDGVTPGDGMGAGGLDSEFYSHLKRNWIWNCHLLDKTKPAVPGLESSPSMRLRNLINKHLLTSNVIAVKEQGTPCVLLPKVLGEQVEVAMEPSSRNQQNRGGKQQRRKRPHKEMTEEEAQKKQEEKRKKRRKKDKNTKPLVILDQTDQAALRRMTRMRVAWSQQEDSLLMLCRVACHFLNRKIRRPFVQWHVVRDLLHAEFELSLDKTSLSVGRRARYIMKNPQTHLNFKVCLAEVYQDKPLVADFNSRQKDYNNPQVCAEEFKEFVTALRKKFSKPSGCSVEIPDTKQELFQRFKVYAIANDGPQVLKDDLKSEDEIHSIVIHNLLQSTLALSSSEVKNRLSFQMFHLYSRYKHAVLYAAFLKCQKSGLINRRRADHRYSLRKDRSLPIMPMSYQLSQSYYKAFSWRFPSTMFSDAYDYLEKLLEAGDEDKPSLIYMLPKECVQEREGQEEGRGRTLEEEPKESSVPTEEKEEENNEQETVATGPTDAPVDTLMDPNENASEAALQKKPEVLPITPPPSPEGMVLFPLDALGGACLASLSLMTLGRLTVDMAIPEQIVVVDTSLLDADVVKRLVMEVEQEDEAEADEERGAEENTESRKRVELPPSQASHTNYLLMRGYCMPGALSSRLRTSSADCVVVNACTLHTRLRHTPQHTLFGHRDPSVVTSLLQAGPCIVPKRFSRTLQGVGSDAAGVTQRCTSELGYSAADVSAILEVWRSVDGGKSYGVDLRDLFQICGHLVDPQGQRQRGLLQYIQDLVELQELIEEGAHSPRLVCWRHAQPWLLSPLQLMSQAGAASSTSNLVNPDSTHALHALRGMHMPPWRVQRRGLLLTDPGPPQGLEQLVQSQPRDAPGSGSFVETGEPKDTPGAKGEREAEEVEKEAEGELLTSPEERSKERETEGEREEAPPTKKRRDESEEVGEQESMKSSEEIRTPREEGEQEEVVIAQPEEGEKKEEEIGTVDNADEKPTDGSVLNDTDDLPSTEDQSTDHFSFPSRPWRSVDGGLNRIVCKGMLEGIMNHILSRPGLTEPELTHHYTRVLEPTTVLELVQTLVELGCVRRRYMRLPPLRATLFSLPLPSSLKVQEEGENMAGRQGYMAFYEPTVEAGLMLPKAFPHETHWNHWSASTHSAGKQKRTAEDMAGV